MCNKAHVRQTLSRFRARELHWFFKLSCCYLFTLGLSSETAMDGGNWRIITYAFSHIHTHHLIKILIGFLIF
jgi:hypothetical protein